MLTLLGVVACGPSRTDLFLALPRPEGAKSLVVGEAGPNRVALFGADLEDPFHLELEPAEGATLWAVGLSARLADFGISPGPLAEAEADSFGVRDGGIVRAYRAAVDADRSIAEWIETSDVERRVLDFSIERSLPPCATFTQVEAFHLPGSLTFAVPLDGERALLGTNQLAIYVVSSASADPIPSTGTIRSAFRDGATVYFGDYFGEVYRAAIGSIETRELATTSPISDLAILTGGGGKMIAVSRLGDAAFYDGSAWIDLPSLDVGTERVKAAWGSDEGFYWIRGTNRITRVSAAGEPTTETLEVAVFSISNLGDGGVVLGTGDGSFLSRQGGAWATVGGNFGWWGLDSEPYLDGFFFLLASGAVGQYRPNRPLCADQPVLGFINDGQIVVLDRRIVAAGWDGDRGVDIEVIDL